MLAILIQQIEIEDGKLALYFTNIDHQGSNAFGFNGDGQLQCLDLLTHAVTELPVAEGDTALAISQDEGICYFNKRSNIVGVTFDGELNGEVEFDCTLNSLLLVDESTLWISGRRTYILDLESSATQLIDEIRSQTCHQMLLCSSRRRVLPR